MAFFIIQTLKIFLSRFEGEVQFLDALFNKFMIEVTLAFNTAGHQGLITNDVDLLLNTHGIAVNNLHGFGRKDLFFGAGNLQSMADIFVGFTGR